MSTQLVPPSIYLTQEDNPNYQQALKDLAGLTVSETDDEGLPVAEQVVVARAIVEMLFIEAAVKCAVYTNPNREVVILASGGHGHSMDVRCRPDGDFQCFVTVDGTPGDRAWFSNRDQLSKGYLVDAFRKVARLRPSESLPVLVGVRETTTRYYFVTK